MDRPYYENRIQEIDHLHQEKQYACCIRDCGALFESALRDLLADFINDLEDAGKRDEILAAERKVADGNQSFKKFGLGQLVGLYNEGRIFEKLRPYLQSPLPRLRRIIWSDVVDLRNTAVHRESAGTLGEEDAVQMYYWLKTFLSDTRIIAGTRHGKEGQATACPQCKISLKPEWKFCPDCGTQIFIECASCGGRLEPTFKLCPYCETAVNGKRAASRETLRQYELLFRGANLDMIITAHEREMLEQTRLQLGISAEQAEEIEIRSIPKEILEFQRLVEAVYVDGEVNTAERALLDRKIRQLKIDPTIARNIEEEIKRNQNSEAL